MKKTIRFFRIDEGMNKGWYADVPGHALEDNEMVAGADTFLEEVDKVLGGRGEVTLSVSDSCDVSSSPFIAKLCMKSHDSEGASYVLTGPIAEQYDAVGFELWICNVTHDVMGEHPECIYIFDIQ